MIFDTILIPPRRDFCIATGLWHDRTIHDEMDRCLELCPDKIALTAVQSESGDVTRLTYRELSDLADKVALGLVRLGISRDDVVACQLPNWWQFTVIYLACSRIGAVINPLMHIFREHELSFMLKHGGAKALVIPRTFRGFNYEEMVDGLKPSLPDLKHVLVVNGLKKNSFEALLTNSSREDVADVWEVFTKNRPKPDDVTQLMYTSGTTGEPKGVMHTANTTISNIVTCIKYLGLDHKDTIFMASPMAHQTGFMYGLMMPIVLNAHAVLLDQWDPLLAIDLISNEHATFTMAATPYLIDLVKNVEATGKSLPTLKTFICAGAPIPSSLVSQAQNILGVKVLSAWGMTETGIATLIGVDDPDERAINSDGRPLPGVEIKIIDEDGLEIGAGKAGKLLVRSSFSFGGYLKRPHLNNTDSNGWFDTGDIARLDDQSYIRITGRSKDLIIRGGENIPVLEIESLIYRHPAIKMAAIVSYPDERLGERACAVAVLKDQHKFDFNDLVELLRAEKVATQFIPEKLLILDSMPMTITGKIQKYKLRDHVLRLTSLKG